MATGSSIDFVQQRMRDSQIRNFAIYDQDKKTLFDEVKDDSLTVDEAITRVKNTLDNLNGLVFVELAPVSKAARATGGGQLKNFWIPVQLGVAINRQAAPVQSGIGALEQFSALKDEALEARLSGMEERFKKDLEIADLRRKIAELEAKTPFEKYFDPYAPFIIPHAINGMFNTNIPIQGITRPADPNGNPAQTVDCSAEEVARAEKGISKMLSLDPDFLNVLERLALLAETQPGMYAQAKMMLPPKLTEYDNSQKQH